jgi:hypothetical protein
MLRSRKLASVNNRNSSPACGARAIHQAEGMLVEMINMLDAIRDHLERLQQRPEGQRDWDCPHRGANLGEEKAI